MLKFNCSLLKITAFLVLMTPTQFSCADFTNQTTITEQQDLLNAKTAQLKHKKAVYYGITTVSLLTLFALPFAFLGNFGFVIMSAICHSMLIPALIFCNLVLYALYKLIMTNTKASSFVRNQKDILSYETAVVICPEKNLQGQCTKSFKASTYPEIAALTKEFVAQQCRAEENSKISVTCRIEFTKNNGQICQATLRKPIHLKYRAKGSAGHRKNLPQISAADFANKIDRKLKEKFLVLPDPYLASNFALSSAVSAALMTSWVLPAAFVPAW